MVSSFIFVFFLSLDIGAEEFRQVLFDHFPTLVHPSNPTESRFKTHLRITRRGKILAFRESGCTIRGILETI